MKEECCAYIDAEASIRFPFRNKLQMLIETLGANLEKILNPRVVPTCLIYIYITKKALICFDSG